MNVKPFTADESSFIEAVVQLAIPRVIAGEELGAAIASAVKEYAASVSHLRAVQSKGGAEWDVVLSGLCKAVYVAARAA